MFGFVGRNGARKTTAMRITLRMPEPNAREIRWRGQQMNDELRNYLGHMLQDYGQTFSIQCARIRGTAAVTPLLVRQ